MIKALALMFGWFSVTSGIIVDALYSPIAGLGISFVGIVIATLIYFFFGEE